MAAANEILARTGNGLIAVVKRDCPTCELVGPVLASLQNGGAVTVFSQDDPTFPEVVAGVEDDRDLDASYRLDVEIVPTLIRVKDGQEVDRTYGWDKGEWSRVSGLPVGGDLPATRPGCGAANVEPAAQRLLKIRYGETGLKARRVELGGEEDTIEAGFERGWSDGLPLTPPTEARVLAMLEGSARAADEVVGIVPPNLDACTVEKAAINAVMAGCKPEYFPVVLAALEAVLDPAFNMHGVLATTMFVGPVLVVNGPIANRIGMNGKHNVLGQGNRANLTIGRAVQLIVRNVGGGKPGGIDRAALGNPGKLAYCFAEDEAGSVWTPLAADFGFAEGENAVTAFTGYGLQGIVDQKSREPESLARSIAGSLCAVSHAKAYPGPDILLVICPEHERTFKAAGWSKDDLRKRLMELTTVSTDGLIQGDDGMAEGLPESMRGKTTKKIREGGLLIVRAGGGAGMFSGIIGGWSASAEKGSVPVTKAIRT
jgi:hypothetical protein